MVICPNCGFRNRMGLLFCEDCGANLTDKRAAATISTHQIQEELDESAAKATWGAANFGKGTRVLLHVRDASDPIELASGGRMTIGRHDTSSDDQPDIDLTPHGALEKGVSRYHAAIEFGEGTLTLSDVGSSNGTFLNGQRLIQQQPRILRDGDEIRFGKLVAHIYFK